MGSRGQQEIVANPEMGRKGTESKDDETFEDASFVPGLVDSRNSSPARSLRQQLNQGLDSQYRETRGVEGSTGIGRLPKPVMKERTSRGNPFCGSMQVVNDQPAPGNQRFPNLSNQNMKIDEVSKSNFHTWKARMVLASINVDCYVAFQEPMPNSRQNAAALSLLLNSTPKMWHARLVKERTAHDAMHWVMDQYDGGKNQFHVNELEREFHALKMKPSPKETYEEYVMRANDIAINLDSNAREVNYPSLVDKIVNGLPAVFDTSKSSLRLLGRSLTIEELCSTIKNEGFQLEATKPKGSGENALAAYLSPVSRDQGRKGAPGKAQHRKIKGDCWNCGKPGHSHTDCRSPPSNFAFRPLRGGNGAEPRALISKQNGSWSVMVEGSEWVVDSGASHHVTGDPSLLHEYFEYNEPIPLTTAVKNGNAQIVGQGSVCLEGNNGTTFWLRDVRFVPGLTQNLFSMCEGIEQRLALDMNSRGDF
jgi:hypothetical protein